MTDEQFAKLLPVAGTVISIIGGLALNYINDHRERIRQNKADTDAQEIVNRLAVESQEKIAKLEAEKSVLAAEKALLEAENIRRDQRIAELERRLNAGVDDGIEREIDLDIDMG